MNGQRTARALGENYLVLSLVFEIGFVTAHLSLLASHLAVPRAPK